MPRGGQILDLSSVTELNDVAGLERILGLSNQALGEYFWHTVLRAYAGSEQIPLNAIPIRFQSEIRERILAPDWAAGAESWSAEATLLAARGDFVAAGECYRRHILARVAEKAKTSSPIRRPDMPVHEIPSSDDGSADKTPRSLEEHLLEARDLFREDPRRGALLALNRAIDFLQETGISPSATEPLFALQVALHDLGMGVVDPMLRRPKVGGKGPIGNAAKSARGMVAAIMELLIQSGMERKPAAKMVSEKIRNWSWGEARLATASRIENWRDAALAGVVNIDQDATTFAEMIGYFADHGYSPSQAAQALLAIGPAFLSKKHDSRLG